MTQKSLKFNVSFFFSKFSHETYNMYSLSMLLIVISFVHDSTAQRPYVFEFCRDTEVNLNIVGARAQIKSESYPAYVPNERVSDVDCQMYIRVCESCKMVITVEEVEMPQCYAQPPAQGSCMLECDHLYFHEPDYVEKSYRYLFGNGQRDQNNDFSLETITRSLYIKFCRVTKTNADIAFSLYFTVVAKEVELSSEVNPVITSPFWPEKYNAYAGRDVFPYIIRNPDPNGKVKVRFTDWNILPESFIVIYFDEYRSLRSNGGEPRPGAVSTGNTLKVNFHTGQEVTGVVQAMPYPGFRLEYEFIPPRQYVPETIACGEYLLNMWGGEFRFSTDMCTDVNANLDCVTVINRFSSARFEKVEMTFTEWNLGRPLADVRMHVLRGTLSNGTLISSTDNGNLNYGHVLTDDEGFYVHFTAKCGYDFSVRATFVTMTQKQRAWDCEDFAFWCNYHGRCISDSLLCDGIDHCGNGYDERPSLCPTSPAPTNPCSSEDYYYCESPSTVWYCPHQQCDGFVDCNDGSDERNCPRKKSEDEGSSSSILVIIPAIVVPVLLALCICAFLIYCVHRKRKQRRMRRERPPPPIIMPPTSLLTPPHSPHSPGMPYSVSGSGYLHYPGANPPSYELSQQFINMGYQRSLSENFIDHPPPYDPSLPAGRRNLPPLATASTPHLNTPIHSQPSNLTPASSTRPISTPNLAPDSNMAMNSNMASALAGAGALSSSSLIGIVPTLTPTKQHDISMSPDATKDNLRNMSLESSLHSTDAKTPQNDQYQQPRDQKKRRVKKKLEDSFGSDGVGRDGVGAMGDSSFSPVGNVSYDNTAYQLDHCSDKETEI